MTHFLHSTVDTPSRSIHVITYSLNKSMYYLNLREHTLWTNPYTAQIYYRHCLLKSYEKAVSLLEFKCNTTNDAVWRRITRLFRDSLTGNIYFLLNPSETALSWSFFTLHHLLLKPYLFWNPNVSLLKSKCNTMNDAVWRKITKGPFLFSRRLPMIHPCCRSPPLCVAACCSVLQCAAVCCRFLFSPRPPVICPCCRLPLQCVAVCCSVLQCVAGFPFCFLQCVVACAVCCRFLHLFIEGCCSVLQCVAVCCNVLQVSPVVCWLGEFCVFGLWLQIVVFVMFTLELSMLKTSPTPPCMELSMHMYMNIYTHIYMCGYIYMYIYIHTHI